MSAAGTFDTTPNTKGVTVSGTDVSLAAADGTNPGGVSAAAQTFGGVKTFSAVPVAAGISAPTTSGFTLAGNVTTGASAVGVTIDNLVALTTAGAKIASFQNHEVEKAFIDKDGALYTGNGTGGCLISDAAGPAEGGIYLGAYAVAPNSNNWAMAIYNPDLYINGPSSIHFRTNGSDAMVMTATSLDMTAFGTGGSIKLKDAGGVTRTCTISAGGAWVIT